MNKNLLIEYVCLECNNSNKYIINNSIVSKRYKIDNKYCYTCNKNTKQINMINTKQLVNELKYVNNKTEQEEFAYKMLVKNRG